MEKPLYSQGKRSKCDDCFDRDVKITYVIRTMENGS